MYANLDFHKSSKDCFWWTLGLLYTCIFQKTVIRTTTVVFLANKNLQKMRFYLNSLSHNKIITTVDKL